MTQALGITLSEFEHLARVMVRKAIKDELSMVAVDKATRKVVGTLIAEDFITDPPEGIETVSPKFSPIFALLSTIDEEYKQKHPVNHGQLYHIFMVGVLKEYAGLAPTITKQAEAMAKTKNYLAAIGEATSPISYLIYTKRLAYTEVTDVTPICYADFTYEGNHPFSEIRTIESCKILIHYF